MPFMTHQRHQRHQTDLKFKKSILLHVSFLNITTSDKKNLKFSSNLIKKLAFFKLN